MRLVTLLTSDRETVPGVLISDCVLNLVAGGRHLSELASLPSSIRAILQTGPEALDAISRLLGKIKSKSALLADLEEAGAVTKLSDAKLLAPVPNPALILSCGLNYHEHLREMNTPMPITPTAVHEKRGFRYRHRGTDPAAQGRTEHGGLGRRIHRGDRNALF